MQNSNNRRDFLKKSALGFAGLTTATLGFIPLVSSCKDENQKQSKTPTSSKLAVRKNIAEFEKNDPELKLFKDAVALLKKRSLIMPLDPMGWDAHGMLHASFCATSMYSNQVHYNWYVWPWHRLYLWSMEKKLQQAVSEPTLALHYWDWTKGNKIPELYWGDDNPLNNSTRLVNQNDEIPNDFINIGAALRASNYNTFGGYPAIKKKGENQLDGIAEQTFHNSIHNWIGGQMATFTESGFDPIFYGHHGNCDRIWKAWQKYSDKNQLPKDQEWLDKKLYATDGNGKPIEFKISELIDNESLGYDFQNLDLNPTFCNPFEIKNHPERKVSASDCKAKLNIPKNDIYTEYLNKDRSHIILHFERAQLPYQPYCARIYFEFNSKSMYTGTFTILPIQDIDSVLLQNGVFLQIEVPREVFIAINDKMDIDVVFQPVPLPNRQIPEKPLKLENITLKTSV